jgi:hypothetical protein
MLPVLFEKADFLSLGRTLSLRFRGGEMFGPAKFLEFVKRSLLTVKREAD